MNTDQAPVIGIKDAERRLRWLAAIVIFNVVLSTASQDAMFLAHHQKQNIPPAMLVGSLLTALTTLGLNRLLRKRPAAGALRIILLVLSLMTLGAAVWNIHPGKASTFVLFLFIEVATTVGVAATWTYFQAPLEASQIRWLLPRLGTYAGLGGLVAGTALQIALRRLAHPQILVWCSAAAWFIASMLVRSDYAARAPAKRRGGGAGQQSHLRQLFSIPLVRWMTVGSAGIIWTGLLLQYETRVALQAAFQPATIASVTGILLAFSSVSGIAVQAMVTTPVLDRWGVGLALAILPMSLAIFLGTYFYTTAYALWAPVVTVWIIVGAQFLDKTLRPNLHRPAESCLVAALSPAIRPSLLLVLGGLLQPLLKAVGALVLWAVAANVDARWISMSAVLLALAVTVLSSQWGNLYARALRETLEEGSVDALGTTDANEELIPMIDGPRLRVLLEAIDTGSPRSRELALELLRSHRSNLVSKAMQSRMRHPFEPVRIAALRWLAEEPNPDFETHLKQRWAERNITDKERVALLQAAGSGGASLIGDETARWLSAPNPMLRSQVIAALLRSDDARHQKVARRALEGLLNSRSVDECVTALRLVHEHRVAEFLPAVLLRVQDGDLTVRRESLACLPAFADDRARRPLWAALSEPQLAHVAVRALSSFGEAIVPSIIAQLGAPETTQAVRLHLLRALGMVPSHQGIPCLLEHLRFPDRAAQLEALKSLNKQSRADEHTPMDPVQLTAFLMSELRWGLHMLRARDLLKDRLKPGGLLWRELDSQVESAQQRVALTLALLSPRDTMVHIFKALSSPASPHRDQARELLRTLFKPGPIVSGSLKLLDESTAWSGEFFHPPLNIATGQTAEAAVDWLKLTMDPWIVAALRHDPDCPPITTTFPAVEDPINAFKDAVSYLKEVSLFETLNNPQLIGVAKLAETLDLPAGTRLFDQDDPPDYLYLVRKGKLRVITNEQEVARLGPGECVGEMAVLAGTRRTAAVETLEPCQLLRFSERDFLGLVDAFPEIGRALLKSLVRRLAQTGKTKETKRASTIIGMAWNKDGTLSDDNNEPAGAAAHASSPSGQTNPALRTERELLAVLRGTSSDPGSSRSSG